MVRVVFGPGLDEKGTVEVPARTLSEALDQLDGVELDQVRAFVGGVDAARLEAEHTPVGDEDEILLTDW